MEIAGVLQTQGWAGQPVIAPVITDSDITAEGRCEKFDELTRRR